MVMEEAHVAITHDKHRLQQLDSIKINRLDGDMER